jgi:hypothetical protein
MDDELKTFSMSEIAMALSEAKSEWEAAPHDPFKKAAMDAACLKAIESLSEGLGDKALAFRFHRALVESVEATSRAEQLTATLSTRMPLDRADRQMLVEMVRRSDEAAEAFAAVEAEVDAAWKRSRRGTV